LWKDAGDGKSPKSPGQIENELRGVVTSCCAKILRDLYPTVEVFA
jgi:hypothetical protein